jgi:hypothetical protein
VASGGPRGSNGSNARQTSATGNKQKVSKKSLITCVNVTFQLVQFQYLLLQIFSTSGWRHLHLEHFKNSSDMSSKPSYASNDQIQP